MLRRQSQLLVVVGSIQAFSSDIPCTQASFSCLWQAHRRCHVHNVTSLPIGIVRSPQIQATNLQVLLGSIKILGVSCFFAYRHHSFVCIPVATQHCFLAGLGLLHISQPLHQVSGFCSVNESKVITIQCCSCLTSASEREGAQGLLRQQRQPIVCLWPLAHMHHMGCCLTAKARRVMS